MLTEGGGIGYDGSKNTLAIEYDIYHNTDRDPNGNHVGISRLGSTFTNPTVSPSFDIYGGERHSWIDYDFSTKILNVYLSLDSTKPASPLISTSVDIEEIFLRDSLTPPPFTGGQCAGVKYGVNFRITTRNYTDGFTTVQSGAWGPIRGFVLENTPNTFGYPTYRLFVDGHGNINTGGPTSEPTLVYVRDFDDQNRYGDFKVEITSVFRLDGQPDNCGDLKPT